MTILRNPSTLKKLWRRFIGVCRFLIALRRYTVTIILLLSSTGVIDVDHLDYSNPLNTAVINIAV